MKKQIQKIGKILVPVLLILAMGFAGGYAFCLYQQTQNAEIMEQDTDHFDLRLPGEVEKRVVTKDEVVAKLVEIGQLATYSGEYTVSKSVDSSRYLLDNVPIPGTSNTISLTCSGIVKVGYDIEDINPVIDDESQKIYISLPAPAVLDNYVIWDRVIYSEANNILNPIDFAQYKKLVDEIEQEGLSQVEKEGIYRNAEENVKVLILNFLAGFGEYEVIFM